MATATFVTPCQHLAHFDPADGLFWGESDKVMRAHSRQTKKSIQSHTGDPYKHPYEVEVHNTTKATAA